MTTGPKLLLLAISGSVGLLLLGSVFMSDAHVTTGAHASHVLNHPLNHVLKFKGSAKLTLPLTAQRKASFLTREMTPSFAGPGIVDLTTPAQENRRNSPPPLSLGKSGPTLTVGMGGWLCLSPEPGDLSSPD